MSPEWPIETERLVLRPYESGDFDALHAFSSDAEVARWLELGFSFDPRYQGNGEWQSEAVYAILEREWRH